MYSSSKDFLAGLVWLTLVSARVTAGWLGSAGDLGWAFSHISGPGGCPWSIMAWAGMGHGDETTLVHVSLPPAGLLRNTLKTKNNSKRLN